MFSAYAELALEISHAVISLETEHIMVSAVVILK